MLIVSGCSPVLAEFPGVRTLVPIGAPGDAGDPVWARDEALSHLGERYPEQAPVSDLAWMEADVTGGELLGSSTFQYVTSDWIITITYPIVALEDTIYEIRVDSGESGFSWRGEVDAQGEVSDIKPPAPTARPSESEGEPVEDWIGVIVDLPPGNQFGQYFEREDGEEYTIGTTDENVRERIRDAVTARARVRIWGTLFTGVPATQARHVQVLRLEVLPETTQE